MKKNTTKSAVATAKKSVKSTAKSTKASNVVEKSVTDKVCGCEIRFGKTQVSMSADGYKATLRPAKNHILLKEVVKGKEPVTQRIVKASLSGTKKGDDGAWSVNMSSESADDFTFKFATRAQALDFKKSFNEFFAK